MLSSALRLFGWRLEKGNPYDNAAAESFMKTLKYEIEFNFIATQKEHASNGL